MNSKLLITTLMLLAFIGQTVAVAAVPCFMNQTTLQMSPSDSSTMTDHSMHQVEKDADAECHSDCSCPMATCLSVLISSDTVVNSTVNVKQSFDVPTSLDIVSSTNSLYRPPITR